MPTNSAYAKMTSGFRYSLMGESYVFRALFLSMTCEMALMKTDASRMPE